MESISIDLERVAWALRFGAQLAQWMRWMQLAVIAAMAAWLGWVGRGIRAARAMRAHGSIGLNPNTGFYEYVLNGQLHEFVFAPASVGAQRQPMAAEEKSS